MAQPVIMRFVLAMVVGLCSAADIAEAGGVLGNSGKGPATVGVSPNRKPSNPFAPRSPRNPFGPAPVLTAGDVHDVLQQSGGFADLSSPASDPWRAELLTPVVSAIVQQANVNPFAGFNNPLLGVTITPRTGVELFRGSVRPRSGVEVFWSGLRLFLQDNNLIGPNADPTKAYLATCQYICIDSFCDTPFGPTPPGPPGPPTPPTPPNPPEPPIIPEPMTSTLFGLGLAVAGLASRSRSKHVSA